MFDLLQYEFNQRALLAACLIGFSNGALGTFVVLRRSSLLLSALAHSVMPGIALGVLWFGVLTPMVGFMGALGGALLVGLGTVYVSRIARLDVQTAMSVLYTTAFAGGLMLLDFIKHTGELEHWLFGNILLLRSDDLWMAYLVSAVVVVLLALNRRSLSVMLLNPDVARSVGIPVRSLNYILMTLVVAGLITSLQAVGAVLSAALYITPTATMMQFVACPRKLMWGSGLLGAVTAVTAVVLSGWWDLRTGTLIILLLGLEFMVALVVRSFRRGRHHTAHA